MKTEEIVLFAQTAAGVAANGTPASCSADAVVVGYLPNTAGSVNRNHYVTLHPATFSTCVWQGRCIKSVICITSIGEAFSNVQFLSRQTVVLMQVL